MNRKLLEEWFNNAVNDILAIIDSQLEALAREHKSEKIVEYPRGHDLR